MITVMIEHYHFQVAISIIGIAAGSTWDHLLGLILCYSHIYVIYQAAKLVRLVIASKATTTETYGRVSVDREMKARTGDGFLRIT